MQVFMHLSNIVTVMIKLEIMTSIWKLNSKFCVESLILQITMKWTMIHEF